MNKLFSLALAASMLMSPIAAMYANATTPVINVQTAEGATKLDVNIKQEKSNVPYYEKPEYAHLKTPYSVRKVQRSLEAGWTALGANLYIEVLSFLLKDPSIAQNPKFGPALTSALQLVPLAQWLSLAAAAGYFTKTALAKNAADEILNEEHTDTINENKVWSIAGLLAVGGVIAAKCAAMAGLIK